MSIVDKQDIIDEIIKLKVHSRCSDAENCTSYMTEIHSILRQLYQGEGINLWDFEIEKLRDILTEMEEGFVEWESKF